MAEMFYKAFEKVDYPCCFLGGDGSFWENECAKARGEEERQALKKGLSGLLSAAQSAGANMRVQGHDVLAVEDGLLAVLRGPDLLPPDALNNRLRDPVSNIFAVLPLLAVRMEPDGEKYLEEVKANCYRLLRFISNMETLRMLPEGVRQKTVVDLSSLISSLAECAQGLCLDDGVSWKFSICQEALPVEASAQVLSELFLNLIRNSLQYTRDGNVIEVVVQKSGSRAVLMVKDRGLGIRSEILPDIFTPHFSADPYGDGEDPGAGLGLAIVKQATEAFSGTVTVESRFGEGTNVAISLPLAEAGGEMLSSAPSDFMLNRYSPVYIQLSDYGRLPEG